MPHIGKEVLESLPAAAYLDASAAISVINGGILITASLPHTDPDSISRRSPLPVLDANGANYFVPEATTAFSCAFFDVRDAGDCSFAAIAVANPKRSAVLVLADSLLGHKAAKSLATYIQDGKHHEQDSKQG